MIVKRQFLAPVLAVITLIAATGVLASNMGFKRILRLKGPDGGQTSASGKNHIGLPYIPKQGIVTVRDLFFDIGGSISSISQHRKSDDQFELYSATVNTVPPDGWVLKPGEGYVVMVSGDVDYRAVGSHDPGATVSLIGSSSPESATGKNYVALPYNALAGNARDLFFEIGGSITSISQHRKSDDQFELYSATVNTVPPDGFPLEDGDAVIIITTNDELFVPSHY